MNFENQLRELLKIICGMYSIVILSDGSGYIRDFGSLDDYVIVEFDDIFDFEEVERVITEVKKRL